MGSLRKSIKNLEIVRIQTLLCSLLEFCDKCGVKVGSNRFLDFQEICRWGAYENHQKSRNHLNPNSTLQFLRISRSMRSKVRIRSIFRFFRKIADAGAYENQQKSRSRPDLTFTLQFLGFFPNFSVKVGTGRFLRNYTNTPAHCASPNWICQTHPNSKLANYNLQMANCKWQTANGKLQPCKLKIVNCKSQNCKLTKMPNCNLTPTV